MANRSFSTVNHVQKVLENLRNEPADSDSLDDSVLSSIFNFLMSIPFDDTDRSLHWFCAKADALTREAAIFLLRLFAYDSPQVNVWKKSFRLCMSTCCKCAMSVEEAKETSRKTYFAVFYDHVFDQFLAAFGKWELDCVLEDLRMAGVLRNEPPHNATGRSLSTVRPELVYRMVCNLYVFQDPRVMSAIMSSPPTEPFTTWPTDPVPVGILILLMNENDRVREWAMRQTSLSRNVPMALDTFRWPYRFAVEVQVAAFVPGATANKLDVDANDLLSNLDARCSFSTDRQVLWSSFEEVLRFVPSELYLSHPKLPVDIRRLVISHLHDNGPEFPSILRCFVQLLTKSKERLWEGEGPEYSQIVFDSVKDNPAFTTLLRANAASDKIHWSLSWLGTYLPAIREEAVYSEALAKIADFLCEELQHERFSETRPSTMLCATKLLKAQGKGKAAAISKVLEIHADILVNVAFARSYTGPEWSVSRQSARDFISLVLAADIDNVMTASEELNTFSVRVLRGEKVNSFDDFVRPLFVQDQLWQKSSTSLLVNDIDALATMISLISRCCHLDAIMEKSYVPEKPQPQLAPHVNNIRRMIEHINNAISTVTDALVAALTSYTNYNTSASAQEVLRRPGITQATMKLLLSPIDKVQDASKSFVGLAFDVDVRSDCFRALLQNLPDQGFPGLFDFLRTFESHAPKVPEACSLSKSLVRCFTDVIEVLCAPPDGLLHAQSFLRPSDDTGPAAQALELWQLMSRAVLIIFKRTPAWSKFYSSSDMTVWMRDAIIFGRDMLAQRRVIEAAATRWTGASSSTSTVQKMMDALQGPLLEISRWLRLTDQELLHQTFSLLESLLDCFRTTQVKPAEEALQKLSDRVREARDPARQQSRLDANRANKLEVALASFDEDDEIEIVSYTPAAPALEKPRIPSESRATPASQPPQKPATFRSSDKVRSKQVEKARRTGYRFTEQDQQRLDAASSSIPTYRRPSAKQSIPTSSKAPATSQPRSNEFKNEGTITRTNVDSSSSDSDSDPGESQADLSSLARLQKSPKIKKMVPRRQIKAIDLPLTVNPMEARLRREQEQREALRMGMRLRPDISCLHRVILSWDYDHQGQEPPGRKLTCAPVPDTFRDYTHYREIFEPLLLLECWSQILGSKDEPQEAYESQITEQRYDGDWLDLEVAVTGYIKKEKGEWYLTESDLVLLRHPDGKRCALGKVTGFRSTMMGTHASVRCYSPSGTHPGLSTNSTWRISKVMSLSTLHREYAALLAVQYYDFHDTILRPDIPSIEPVDRKIVTLTMEKYALNEPQAKAICNALRVKGFSLIQGPPGTGKTSTICGLVAASPVHRTTDIVPGRSNQPSTKQPKILICAPSNAAIDEIAKRLKEGSGFIKNGRPVSVVRVGADSSINTSVKDISLDSLIDEKVGSAQQNKDAANEIASLRQQIETERQRRQQIQSRIDDLQNNNEGVEKLRQELKDSTERRKMLSSQFDRLKDKQKSEQRSMDAARRRARVEVLQEAEVICSTLSSAGHESLETCDFETIIIDEAAQAIELSSLIPLRYRCTRCIMVGDPQQLPPTVVSLEASSYRYNQSLFVRLQKRRPEAVHLLSIQYRMHPEISRLPSFLFYENKLEDGPSMKEKTEQEWHLNPKFGPYKFFDVIGTEERVQKSHKNVMECTVAVELYNRLITQYTFDFDHRIGVVSMYRAQLSELRKTFQNRFGSDVLRIVDFNTVDGFQGQEKDIIILSCVRAGPGVTNVGFLSDIRRMNVALTRAKSSLFILGNAATLERSNEYWNQIISDAKSRALFASAKPSFFRESNQPGSAPPAKRQKKSQNVPTVPAPSGLMTPKSFKALGSNPSPSRALPPSCNSQLRNTSDIGDDSKNLKRKHEESLGFNPSNTKNDSKALKRKREESLNSNQAVASTSSNSKRPPVKRPKGLPNIFLPKKSQVPK